MKKLGGDFVAICVTRTSTKLGTQFILTPERYNPKRRMELSEIGEGVLLSEIVLLANDTLTVKKHTEVECYQINTSDAMGGCLRLPQVKEKLNSNKKILRQGDVIISRLRPYLRQVAYVDIDKGQDILGSSTEFYILRPIAKESIAFIVPFLLSEAAQTVFANSVEGSQHPRFKEEDILNLVIPERVFINRHEISERFEKSISSYRLYEKGINDEVKLMNNSIYN